MHEIRQWSDPITTAWMVQASLDLPEIHVIYDKTIVKK
jgi:hypothetical protein